VTERFVVLTGMGDYYQRRKDKHGGMYMVKRIGPNGLAELKSVATGYTITALEGDFVNLAEYADETGTTGTPEGP